MGSLKRVHTEVSDSSLSDKESTSSFQKGSKTSKLIAFNWQRLLLTSSSDEGPWRSCHLLLYRSWWAETRSKTKEMGHYWSSVRQRNISNVFSNRLYLPMCPSKCRHIPPLIHQRELSEAETWKALVMKKYLKTFHHKMLQTSGE